MGILADFFMAVLYILLWLSAIGTGIVLYRNFEFK